MMNSTGRVALVVITDGRFPFLQQTLHSLDQFVSWPWIRRVIVDDSGDQAYGELLARTFTQFEHVHHAQRRGFAGAVRSAWASAGDCEYVFHLEDDFRFTRRVELSAMQATLAAHPYLVQMALLRQAVSPEERAAGGIVQLHPDDFFKRGAGGACWIEHRRFFTTNPSLVPRWVTLRGFADPPGAEGRFSEQLFGPEPRLHSAFWGSGDTWVEHLGAWRTSSWQE